MKKISKVLITMLTLAVCLSGVLPLCVSAVEDAYIYPNVRYYPTSDTIITNDAKNVEVSEVDCYLFEEGECEAIHVLQSSGDAIYNFTAQGEILEVQGQKSSIAPVFTFDVISVELPLISIEGLLTIYSYPDAVYITTNIYQRSYMINGEVRPMMVQTFLIVYSNYDIRRIDVANGGGIDDIWIIFSSPLEINLLFKSDYTVSESLVYVQFFERFKPRELTANNYAIRYMSGYTDIINKAVESIPDIITIDNPIIAIVLIIFGVALIFALLKIIKNMYRR